MLNLNKLTSPSIKVLFCLMCLIQADGFSEKLWTPKGQIANSIRVFSAVAKPSKSLDIASEVSGKVKVLPVDFGQEVLADQFIKIDDDRIVLDVKLKELELESSQKKLQMAKSQVELSQSNYDFASKNLKRSKALFNKGSLSEREFDKIENDEKVFQENLQQAKIHLADVALQVKLLQTRLDLSKDLLNRHKIKLPAGWVVSHKYIELDSMVNASQALIRVADLSQFKFEFYLDPKEVLALQQESFIELDIENSMKEKYHAKLKGVSPVADTKTQKPKVEIVIDNASKSEIIAGSLAKLTLKVPSPYGFLQVPKSSVKKEFEQAYLLDEKNKKYPITIIRTMEDHYHISPLGLPEGPFISIVD